MFKLIIVFIAAVCLTEIESACNTCNTHGFTCTNVTHYRICNSKGLPIEGVPSLPCGEGQYCTDLAVMCTSRAISSAPPACSNACDVCETGKRFACTGPKSFARCNGLTLDKSSAGVCPGTTVCDTRTENICVEACNVDFLTCDKDTQSTTPTPTPAPTTTPIVTPSPSPSPSQTQTTPTPTPTTTPSPESVCAYYNRPGRFPLDPDSKTCPKDFVMCRYWFSTLTAVQRTCLPGLVFNKNVQLCQFRILVDCED